MDEDEAAAALNENEVCVRFAFDEALVDEIEPVMATLTFAALIAGILLDALAYKWRFLANYIFYLNAFESILRQLRPRPGVVIGIFDLAIYQILYFVMYYTEQGGQLILITLRHFVISFVVKKEIYEKELDLSFCLQSMIAIVVSFLMNTSIAILCKFIADLQKRLKQVNHENVKMLHGMHEGLLILAKSTKKLLFCNSTAEKLLSKALAPVIATIDESLLRNDDENFDKYLTRKLLLTKLFEKIKMQ